MKFLNYRMKKYFLLLTFFVVSATILSAQSNRRYDYDSSYYQSYKGSIIARVFFSKKYNQFSLDPPGNLPKMAYHANTTFSIGVGLTYRSLSFSFSKELSFLKSEKSKGPTNDFDLQLHLYKRKWTIDAIGEFYKGFYLTPHGVGTPDGQNFYVRPDMGVQLVGGSVYRVLNDQRFSYGAGLSQNAWQKKSAGSFLLGGEVFYMAANADSSYIPSKTDSVNNQKNIRKLHLFEFGPGVGYAYTLVIREHFFILGSINVNENLHFSREIGNSLKADNIGLTTNFIFRLGAGYNLSRWGVSLLWIQSAINTKGQSSDYEYRNTIGSYRLVYFRRIALNRRMKRILAPIPVSN